eukprot:m.39115 g.39115  ORF g.39115 m.39115 type:complete len:84 (-) comp10281_c0_seq1:292-543(-)
MDGPSRLSLSVPFALQVKRLQPATAARSSKLFHAASSQGAKVKKLLSHQRPSKPGRGRKVRVTQQQTPKQPDIAAMMRQAIRQ